MPPLITRSVLFGPADRASPTVSPDGTRIAYLSDVDGSLNLWIGSRSDWQAAKPLTAESGAGVQHYTWCFDNRHILYMRDIDGSESWHVLALDVQTGTSRDLTPFEGIAAGIHTLSPDRPDEVLLQINARDPALHDLHKIGLAGGEARIWFQNDGFAQLIADRNFAVRLGMRPQPDGAMQYLQRDGAGQWHPFIDVPADDVLTTRITGFTEDARSVFAVDSRGRDKARLVEISLDTGVATEIASDPQSDIAQVLAHPRTKAVQAYATVHARQHWVPTDPQVARDFATLQAARPGEVHVLSRSRDLDWWVVAYLDDAGPMLFCLFDRARQQVTDLFPNKAALVGLPLVGMRPTTIRSRDGLDLISYLSVPTPTAERPPLVLQVHGGPWSRVHWGYDPAAQWLVNRGYAVLSVNFRGSTGFGKTFLNAGDREWGARMHDDLIDAVDWAVTQGIADPGRIAIMGASYGGYAVLRAMTETPERFACGVSMCGPADLVSFLESVPPYWGHLKQVFARRIGAHDEPEGRAQLRAQSPITNLHRIAKPLLLAHGAHDVRVAEAESEAVATAMADMQIPYLYAVFENEGHILARPENVAAFYALVDVFLAEVLGGRAEPMGDTLDGLELKLSGSLASTMQD
ncbi:MAG: S9 family peptidase [Pseudomonadota bacterium]